MLTICLLILIGYYLKKPVGALVDNLKSVEWKAKFNALWQHIQPYALKALPVTIVWLQLCWEMWTRDYTPNNIR